jgi:glycerophosphoryl diester phosphodiesterase
MAESPLKAQLIRCANAATAYRPSRLSLAHRGGALLQLPEHSLEANLAGARMGAGILECDVTFTADRELVCRHSQCDLHQTTNIVAIPALNAKCTVPFSPATGSSSDSAKKPATAKCCTSDITLAEFKTLCAKMGGFNASATTPEAFLHGTPPDWRTADQQTDPYDTCGTPVSLGEHIALVEALQLEHSPELKAAEVAMPFQGSYTQEMYAQQMMDAFRSAGVPAARVWSQSFSLDDIIYWMEAEPDFARQAMLLDETGTFNLTELSEQGLGLVAPPLSFLLALDEGNRIVPSEYAIEARAAGLGVVAWSLERSGRLADVEGDYYYGSLAPAIHRDGDVYEVLDVLARQAGVRGVFCDWAATVTFYANCMGLFP